LICRTCGKTVDVDFAVGNPQCVTAAASGFKIDEAEVIYWGKCSECVTANRASPGD
jgi:Fur family ferric uptake transcriptional regulator